MAPQPSKRRRRRKLSAYHREVRSLTAEQLLAVAKQYLPAEWTRKPGEWGIAYHDARREKDGRGAQRAVEMPPLALGNFPILYRIAELLAEAELAELRMLSTGRVPSRADLRLVALRSLGIWNGDKLPSRQTLKRYRDVFGGVFTPDVVDRMILEAAGLFHRD